MTPIDLLEAQLELAESQRKTRVLQVAQMRPGQSPAKLKTLRNLERSQRAVTKLHKKAVAYLQRDKPQEPQAVTNQQVLTPGSLSPKP